MHEMRTIATDEPVARCISLTACLLTRLRSAKVAKRIEVSKKHRLHGRPNFQQDRIFKRG